MLHRTKEIFECRIHAVDGELGKVDDVFFDDRTFAVRYFVLDTGKWLPGKRVLIRREAVETDGDELEELKTPLTRREIESGPGVEADPPLALDAKLRYYRDYAWASYPWGGFMGYVPAISAPSREHVPSPESDDEKTHVRSAREVVDYRIEAVDGKLGHVEDFLISAADWTIRYLVVDTRDWLPGNKVVVPPRDIVRMEWADQTAYLNLTKEEIEASPQLDQAAEASPRGPRLMASRS